MILIADLAKKEKPKLIITGASAYSREWDYKKFREIADSIGAFLNVRYGSSCRFNCKRITSIILYLIVML